MPWTFVDPNSWIEDGDFARDGPHQNGRGKRRLGQYMLDLVHLMLDNRQGVRCDKFWKMEITEQGIPRKCDDQRSKNKDYTKRMNQ